ncbi:MAG: helix-turn-helix domain-containing protein [Saprospiraceae bacterium]|nr:helix-turn-helix domain-containing protein [Saprospiraceae bacterium]
MNHLKGVSITGICNKKNRKTAQEYIQTEVIEVAKERILDTEKSISEVANDLGFKYPAHFTRAFKRIAGISPVEYRNLN